MNKKLICSAMVLTITTGGCASNNGTPSKEDWGSTIGAVSGALLGAAVGGKKNRWLAAAIGGAAGFYAGKMIGRNLDERDQQALASSTVNALDSNSSGSSTWKSSHSGATAQIKTGEVTYKSQPQEVKRLATVEAVPSIKLENREYQTSSALRVRSGPGTGYAVINTLMQGDVVKSAGRTDNGWLMLAKDGVTVGYVHGNYVKPYDPAAAARAAGFDLDSVDIDTLPKQEAFAGVDLDALETTASTVTAQAACRDIAISVQTEKGVENKSTKACQNSAGVWELG